MVETIFSALVMAAALSFDALASGFAYSINGTRIRFMNIMLINVIDAACMGVSLFLGKIICGYISVEFAHFACFVILISLGLFKVIQFFVKKGKTKKPTIAKPEISVIETLFLAIALSIDGIGVGLGTAIDNATTTFCIAVVGFSLITDVLFLVIGQILGERTTKLAVFDLSWLSGVILISMAILNLVT